MPAGVIVPYTGATPPTGWLVCDGTSYATATYPDLFAVIGYTYGGGGANFNVPNLKGRVIVGQDAADASFDTRGETGGTKTHTHATHSNHGDHTHAYTGNTGAPSSVGVAQELAVIALADSGHTHGYGGNTGGVSAVDTHSAHDSPSHMNPYMALPYIIKT
jgi:microcystin-dependent protein